MKTKKLTLIALFLVQAFAIDAQSIGFAFSDPKEILKKLNIEEQKLLYECADIIGLNLDSIVPSENELDSVKIRNDSYNVLFVSRSTESVLDRDTKEMKETIVSHYFKSPKFVTPKYQFFILRENGISQIIIQKYY